MAPDPEWACFLVLTIVKISPHFLHWWPQSQKEWLNRETDTKKILNWVGDIGSRVGLLPQYGVEYKKWSVMIQVKMFSCMRVPLEGSLAKIQEVWREGAPYQWLRV